MKPVTLLLGLSLIANIGLAAWLLAPKPAAPANGKGTDLRSAPASAASKLNSARGIAPATSASPDTVSDQPWARMATEDISLLVGRLRAAGFPPRVLRSIVEQRFELRREELTLDGLDHPYWKADAAYPEDPKVKESLDQLGRERDAALKQLFGTADGGEDDDLITALQNRRFGSLSPEAIQRVTSIEREIGKRMTEFSTAFRDGGVQFDPLKIAELEQQKHAEMAKVLTPSELLEYDLRNSPTASRLRSELTGFNTTEAEFRALFALNQAFDQRYPAPTSPGNRDEMAARMAAQNQLREEIKSLLSPDRFAEYQQASNPEYRQLNQLVTRLELPLSSAANVAAVQRDIQQRVMALRAAPAIPDSDRVAQLAALADEAGKRIGAVIGARGLEGYKQYGGQWLQQLQPRAERPNSKKR